MRHHDGLLDGGLLERGCWESLSVGSYKINNDDDEDEEDDDDDDNDDNDTMSPGSGCLSHCLVKETVWDIKMRMKFHLMSF